MNSPASVRARLLNLSKRSGEDFQAILTRYAVERFLFRLGASKYRSDFVLKGAMLFAAWQGNLHRPTKDLDLLGFGSPSLNDVARRIRGIAAMSANDGIVFDPDSVITEVIAEEAEYGGVRAKLLAKLEQAIIWMQIDVGFGDAVEPEPIMSEFPAMLKNIESAILRMYPPEAVIAEKLHAIVVLDIRNSRMKDFYDIWYLATTRSFTEARLRQAISATFDRRAEIIPSEIPFALTDSFLGDEMKTQQWHGFLKRLRLDRATPSLPNVGKLLAQFLRPFWTDNVGDRRWQAGGPWA